MPACSAADLGVEGALQRGLLVLVEDVRVGPVFQENQDDSLITPACGQVQRRVTFIVLQVQVACLYVVVNQGLHTLQPGTTPQGDDGVKQILMTHRRRSRGLRRRSHTDVRLRAHTCRPGAAPCCHCCLERQHSPCSAAAAAVPKGTHRSENDQNVSSTFLEDHAGPEKNLH